MTLIVAAATDEHGLLMGERQLVSSDDDALLGTRSKIVAQDTYTTGYAGYLDFSEDVLSALANEMKEGDDPLKLLHDVEWRIYREAVSAFAEHTYGISLQEIEARLARSDGMLSSSIRRWHTRMMNKREDLNSFNNEFLMVYAFQDGVRFGHVSPTQRMYQPEFLYDAIGESALFLENMKYLLSLHPEPSFPNLVADSLLSAAQTERMKHSVGPLKDAFLVTVSGVRPFAIGKLYEAAQLTVGERMHRKEFRSLVDESLDEAIKEAKKENIRVA